MRRLLTSLGLAVLLIIPMGAAAQFPVPPCPLSFLPCGSGGVVGANAYFWGTFFPMMRIAFIGIALLSFLYYSIQLLLARQEESVVAEAKSAYEMAITGCAVIMLTTLIVEAFAPASGGEIIRAGPLQTGLGMVVTFIKMALATVVFLRITIQGVRLILLQGQGEGETEKQKKQLLNGLFGVAAILLANALVNAMFPGAGTPIIGVELVGMANFVLTLAGMAAVVAVIVAGVMLLVSVDEGLKDRAKKTISGAIIGIVIILSSFAIVNYFLAL